MKKALDLKSIWSQVPPDYYQSGVKHNLLQRIWHFGKLSAVLSLVTLKPKVILDVGCASGWFLSQIKKKFPDAQCIGVDVYDVAIDYGKRLYPELEFKLADGHNIPIKDRSCDLVICSEVLEHVLEPHKVLLEIKRVLKKDGMAVIEMDSGNWLFKIVWDFWTHKLHGVWEDAHIQIFNEKRLQKEILDAGFKIVRKKTFNFTMAVAFKAV